MVSCVQKNTERSKKLQDFQAYGRVFSFFVTDVPVFAPWIPWIFQVS
jgi:hypothetical protein